VAEAPAPFVLQLDLTGRVTARLGSDGEAPADPCDLMAPWSGAKCQLLIDTVLKEGGGYDWELDLAAPGGTVSLRVVGGRGEGGAALGFGTTAPAALEALEVATRDLPSGDEILRNALRARFRSSEQTPAAQDDMFRELWRVNSELAAAHRELIRKNRELEAMRGDRNRMLGMVVHDLRSPLNVVRLAIGILTDGEPAPEKVADLARRVEHGVEMMLRLIDDLLDLSSVEAGELELELGPCDAGRVVERAASMV
jgi:signal transduction histidine kinase